VGKRINRFEVFWTDLEPVQGSEMAKNRPCVILSPDEMNDYLKTVIVAPLTSTVRPIPTRIKIYFNGREESVALDHIRSVSKSRLGNYIGELNAFEIQKIKETLNEMLCN